MNVFWQSLHRYLLRGEALILVLLLLSTILVAVAQILMRNVFGGGLLWADAYTRTSVLWIALLGAMIGSRRQQHIAIDFPLQYLPQGWQRLARRVAHLLTACVCGLAAWFSVAFVRQEYAYGELAFSTIPNWWCQSIIPIAFAMISLRYAISALVGELPEDTPL